MTTSKKIRNALLKKMAQPTIYKKIEAVRKITGNSISREVAVDIVASQEEIDVHSILKNEGRTEELDEFKDTLSKFDFGNGAVKRKPKPQPPQTPSNGNDSTQNNKQSKTIEKIIIVGKKYGIENIDQNWIDSITILNFIETASTKFLMDHDYTEDDVKSMKWEEKLTKLQNKIGEEARLKGTTVRSSIGIVFKNYRQVRNDQDHIAHLPTSHITKDELILLQKNLDIFIKTVFVEHKKYCLKIDTNNF